MIKMYYKCEKISKLYFKVRKGRKMDENIYKKVKDKLLNRIEISENDLRYIKLNANRFKNIKFIKKRKAKGKWLTQK